MKYLHISSKVESRIESLRKSGKTGTVLAKKANHIIESLKLGGIRHMGVIAEKRIRKCWKYDLGWGYRLITLQRGGNIFIPFLGTHDECQRWLENNSRLKEFVSGNGTLFRTCHKSQPPANPTNADPTDIEENAENEVLLKLSDKDLRCIFCGLVEAARKRPK